MHDMKPGRPRADRRGVAAMEFAMIAPVILTMIWGVYDVARALIAWEETYHAATAIAQAAEKMSVSNKNYPNGAVISSLTANQMQNALTSIYAEIPFIGLGNGTGSFTGGFSATLSGVEYFPTCPASNTGVCAPQIANVIWSTYLADGGAQLIKPPGALPTTVWRACGPPSGGQQAQFPNNSTQLTVLLDPNKAGAGGTKINLIPQVVADVQFIFKPTFPLITRTFTFWASASFPAPLGGDDDPIVFDLTDSTSNIAAVLNCGFSI
jgi:Flp pilus assembly protein TadG